MLIAIKMILTIMSIRILHSVLLGLEMAQIRS